MLYYNHDKNPVCCLRFCYFYLKRVWGMASFSAVIEHLHEVNLVSMLVRFAIALLGGGIIGMSRGKRQHAAGLRTHLLVCIGAASVMMTSLYQAQNLGVPGDAFRMPAQVVSGVGFLGAGSILVTGKRHVTGLTTAAGLWASACMALPRRGFYEGAADDVRAHLCCARFSQQARFDPCEGVAGDERICGAQERRAAQRAAARGQKHGHSSQRHTGYRLAQRGNARIHSGAGGSCGRSWVM